MKNQYKAGTYMQIMDSDFTRPKDEYSSYFGRPYDVLVVSDDQTTANMDPCGMS